MIRLLENQIRDMVNQPESGMGYQIVEAEVSDVTGRRTRKGAVYNGELLLWSDEPRASLTRVSSHEMLLETASTREAECILSIRVTPSSGDLRETAVTGLAVREPRGKPATEGDRKETKKGEVFMRFTAYKNDRRVTDKKGLAPGTYATTEEDARNVRTGTEAVERYALPDPKPAKYRFRIDPLEGTAYREGIVQPAYGRKGGGVEVIFDNGTDDDTVSGPKVLPEK